MDVNESCQTFCAAMTSHVKTQNHEPYKGDQAPTHVPSAAQICKKECYLTRFHSRCLVPKRTWPRVCSVHARNVPRIYEFFAPWNGPVWYLI